MTYPCSHVWIDRADPPIARAPYAPFSGPGRRHLKPGTIYHCRNCGAVMAIFSGGESPEESGGNINRQLIGN